VLLRRVNVLLCLIIVVLACFLLISSLLPRTGFIAYSKEWIKDEVLHLRRNKLVISSIGVNGEIYEGDESVLDLGFWRRPYTGTPDTNGNTVIAAHRFLYRYGPNTFFNLDKVRVGDNIKIIWEGITYFYAVTETKIVSSTEIGLEEATEKQILTLYTCISLWDQSDRLVVIAERK